MSLPMVLACGRTADGVNVPLLVDADGQVILGSPPSITFEADDLGDDLVNPDGWTLGDGWFYAQKVLIFSSDVHDGETVTVNGTVYEFDTDMSITGDVAVDVSGGASAAEAVIAFIAAFNGEAAPTLGASPQSAAAVYVGSQDNSDLTVATDALNGSWEDVDAEDVPAFGHVPGFTDSLSQDPLGGGAVIADRTYATGRTQLAGSAGNVVFSLGGAEIGDYDGADEAFTETTYNVASDTTGFVATPDTDYDGTIKAITVQLVPVPQTISWYLPFAGDPDTRQWDLSALSTDEGSGQVAIRSIAENGEISPILTLDRGFFGLFHVDGGSFYSYLDDPDDVFRFTSGGTVRIELNSNDDELGIEWDGSVLSFEGAGGYTFGAPTIIILPDADPHIAGALWNDGGTPTVSAG